MRLAKLIGEIYEQYGSVYAFAEAAGLSYAYLSRMLSGKVDFRKSTIVRIANALNIMPYDFGDYFFPECCADSAQKNND